MSIDPDAALGDVLQCVAEERIVGWPTLLPFSEWASQASSDFSKRHQVFS